MKKRLVDGTHFFCWCMFACYLIALAYFLFFAEATGRTFTERSYHYNLIPFYEIRRFWNYREQLGFASVVLNLAGNVAAFIPFGLFLPLLIRSTRRCGTTLLLGFEFSLLVEFLQLLSKVGSFDVDDILLNTLGVWAGYLLFCLLYAWHRKNRQKRVRK